MIKKKKLQGKNLTNRQFYFKYLNKKKEDGSQITKEELYILLEYANNYDQTTLIVNFDKNIKDENKIIRSLNELLKGRPIQYIIGFVDFLGLNLNVKNVLIPREETKELCFETVKLIKERKISKDIIVDCCSGSGAIGLYLESQFPLSKIFLIERFQKALKTLKNNVESLQSKACILEGDFIKPLLENHIKCDVFICNPPYVKNKSDIALNVQKYEPMNAIYIKNNYYFYRKAFKEHSKFMNDKFLMAFEINYDQEEQLIKIILEYFDKDVEYIFKLDSYGRKRFLFILGGYQ